jgi:DNA-binding transcriptional ArsR family regulator
MQRQGNVGKPLTATEPRLTLEAVPVEPAKPLRELPMVKPRTAPLPQARVVAKERNVTLDAIRALSHPIRLELIAHIAARGPICTCHLEEDLPYTQPAISKHLGILRAAGLITGRRDGRWIYHSVDEPTLDAAREFLNELHASLHRPHVADDCAEDAAT